MPKETRNPKLAVTTSAVVPVSSDFGPRASLGFRISDFGFPRRRSSAFTLIEVMVVVAIMGLIAAMGVPSILQMYHRDGMRKAVGDVEDVCSEARARAILQNQVTYVVFHPPENTFEVVGGQKTGSDRISSSALPAGVYLAMLDIDLRDCSALPAASIAFYPDGTSSEMTLVLHSTDQWEKITLEFATGLTTESDVNE